MKNLQLTSQLVVRDTLLPKIGTRQERALSSLLLNAVLEAPASTIKQQVEMKSTGTGE